MTPDAAVKVLSRRSPYRWQSDLLTDWFMAGRIPHAVDVSTGLGKTAVIGLWLAARATGATLPRRLVYVVDRRAVVDQATKEAEALRDTLGDGEGKVDPRIAEMRQGLGLKPGQWLGASTLRGQLVDNRAWLEDPSAPAIVVGTVDMIGSRLLFSGYGVGPWMRPVHAGLLGADALIVLDEAHLVPPFEALVQQVIAQRTARGGGDGAGIIPPLHLMSLSATGRDQAPGEVFRLTGVHQADPPVRKRLDAAKRLRVLPTVSQKDLADTLARRAVHLAGERGAVLIFCDSRKVAQQVAQKIRPLGSQTARRALLVGERRVLERQMLVENEVLRRFAPREPSAGPRGAEAEPAFLIATSAGEVGIDLDADHMVCDLVGWERMVQRLGRVNRRAEPGEAEIEVVPARFDLKDEEADTRIEDGKVDPHLAALAKALTQLRSLPDEPEVHDASPGAILELRGRTGTDPKLATLLQEATTPAPLRPALTAAVVEAWAMTSLDHHPGRPNVAPWIRGWVDDTPQARVLWRRVFPLPFGFQPAEDIRTVVDKATRRLLDGYFEAARPHLTETLEAPTFRVVDTLKRRAEAWLKPRHAGASPAIAERAPVVVVLDGAGGVEDLFGAVRLSKSDAQALIRLFTGRTLVIDARLGGLDEEGLLDPRADDAPPVWDEAEPVATGARGWTEGGLEVVGRRLWAKPAGAKPEPGWVREYGWPLYDPEADDGEGDVRELRVERLKAVPSAGDASRATPQGLSEHLDWTGADAGGIADRLGLDARMKQVLVVAARVHDLGKDRCVWQDAMCAGRDDRPWAKTSGALADTALLDGYRHEFGSLGDGEDDVRRQIDAPELQELALHLIAAHHGRARPIIKPHDPHGAPSVSAARAREVALRYARLQRRWGPWGLAWWEALLRAADWSASRRIEDAPEGKAS